MIAWKALIKKPLLRQEAKKLLKRPNARDFNTPKPNNFRWFPLKNDVVAWAEDIDVLKDFQFLTDNNLDLEEDGGQEMTKVHCLQSLKEDG